MNKIIPIGTKTFWGTIKAVRFDCGERYYFMVDKRGDVAMMPADVVEEEQNGK